mgnify:CR=1 FL=1|tara:strand:- start:205 stop:786 length:582 start_codon:yes stop_codon:yes gene_type:complete
MAIQFTNLSADKRGTAKVTKIAPEGISALDIGTEVKTGEVNLVLGFKVFARLNNKRGGGKTAVVGISGGMFPIKADSFYGSKAQGGEYMMQRVMMLGDNACLFAALYCEIERIAREWRDLASTVKQVSIWKQMMLDGQADVVICELNEVILGHEGDELIAQFNVAMQALTTLPDEAAAAPVKPRRKGATLPTL